MPGIGLRLKALLITASVAVLLCIALLVVSYTVLGQSYMRLEAHFARQDLSRVRRALEEQLKAMGRTSRDWGAWNDTYAFMADRNQTYIEENLNQPTFTNLDLHFMVLLDTKGQVVLKKGMHVPSGEDRPVPAQMLKYLRLSHLLTQFERVNPRPHTGLLACGRYPLLVAAYPILQSDGRGPSRGTLVQARVLGEKQLQQLSEIVGLPLRLFAHGSLASGDAAADHAGRAMQRKEDLVVPVADDRLEAYAPLYDTYGEPVYAISITKDRLIVAQGEQVVRLVLVILLATVLLASVIVAVATDRTVVARILALKRDVTAVAKVRQPSRRVGEQGTDEIRDLAASINQTLRSLAQADEALVRSERLAAVGTLASGVAHEFNNINVTVLGYADLALHEPGLEPDLCQHLERIRDAALRARDLTQNLLSFAGPHAVSTQPASLVQVVRNITAFLQREFESLGIRMEMELEAVPEVRMDTAQIGQVVVNLLVNASHALIQRPEKRITLRTGHDAQSVWVEVEDSGCGIGPHDVGRIFSPFFTTKGEHARPGSPQAQVRGSGLGLSVCHTIVEQHSGTLTVRSEEGKGSTFRLTLPRHLEDGADVEDGPAAEEAPLPAGAGRTVLVVEDEADVREFLRLVLTKAGYAVRATDDGQEALDWIRDDGVALVLVDLQMPKMWGTAFLEALRRLPGPQPAAIMLTGQSVDMPGESLPAQGVRAVLLKPVQVDELLRAVADALRAAP